MKRGCMLQSKPGGTVWRRHLFIATRPVAIVSGIHGRPAPTRESACLDAAAPWPCVGPPDAELLQWTATGGCCAQLSPREQEVPPREIQHPMAPLRTAGGRPQQQPGGPGRRLQSFGERRPVVPPAHSLDAAPSLRSASPLASLMPLSSAHCAPPASRSRTSIWHCEVPRQRGQRPIIPSGRRCCTHACACCRAASWLSTSLKQEQETAQHSGPFLHRERQNSPASVLFRNVGLQPAMVRQAPHCGVSL